MTIKLSTTISDAMLIVIKSALDSDVNAGKVLCYSGTMPTPTGSAITTQVLLASCPLNNPCGSVANNVLTFNAANVADLAADASGTIGFVRLVDGANGFVLDGNAGTTGSGAFAQFDSVIVVAGGRVDISSIALSVV